MEGVALVVLSIMEYRKESAARSGIRFIRKPRPGLNWLLFPCEGDFVLGRYDGVHAMREEGAAAFRAG